MNLLCLGVLVAEIIRHYLPDLVDMHNYAFANAFNQKKINWGMINKKVLRQLGLDVPEKIIIDLCNGKSGVVEIFLFHLRFKIDEELELRQKAQQQLSSPHQSFTSLNFSNSKNDSINLVSNRSSRIVKPTCTFNHKWVSRLVYEELKQQCLQQEEEIQILRAKLRRLEHVIQLKEIRINELLSMVEDARRMKFNSVAVNKSKNK